MFDFCRKYKNILNIIGLKKSKLIEVFKSLDQRDYYELGKFVRSPFFNGQEKIIRFYDLLHEYYVQLKLIPEKEKIATVIFPNESYDDVKIRLLMSDLNKVIEQYLMHKAFFKDQVKAKSQLASSFRQKKLSKHFRKTIKEAKVLQDKSPYRHAEFFYDRYQIQQEEYQFLSSNKRTEQLNLQEISNTIDITYLAMKLRQTCFLLAHQRVYKAEYDFGLLPDVIQYIEKRGLLNIPAISVYYYCYYSLTRPEQVSYFIRFKELLFEHSTKFPPTEIRDLHILAINYCIKRLNEGIEDYAQEGLDLYKKGLENGYLIEDKLLSRFTYNNIVAMALRKHDYDWTDQFILKYKNALERKYQESTYHFNKARLEYSRKNYDDALELLQKSDFKDLLNNLISKILLLKIYYERQEFNLLESHLDSLLTFIRRKKVIGYHKENYLNIVYYTKKLLTVNFYSSKERQELRQRISQEEILTERDWLLEQVSTTMR